MPTDSPTLPPLLQSLLEPPAYPHDVTSIALRETHISWVLLTGEFAYKIKKPVDLGFVDFTTLKKRHHYCEEELRLNRRFAPDLYLDVVPITQRAGTCRIDTDGDDGDIVEYAVRMKQFDEDLLANRLLKDNKLAPQELSDFAMRLAEIHAHADQVGQQDYGTALGVLAPAEENFEQLAKLINDRQRLQQLAQLQQWTQRQGDILTKTFEQRRKQNFVRECHGDLHLGNIVRWQGALTPFDCIEFNPGFRWVDVLSEVAFLLMDLDDHNRPDLAGRFLNAYLEQTGDFAGLAVLRFSLVYRALVRAKVAALRWQQSSDHLAQQALVKECHSYLDLASTYTEPPCPWIMITHGLSGSGKTYGTQPILERHRAVRIRSDVERKRLFGMTSSERAAGDVGSGLYSFEASRQTYAQLVKLTGFTISSGYSVIIDATFLKKWQRQLFQELAEQLNVSFHILSFDADVAVLRDRIRQRQASNDASDATVEVLEHQLRTCEPLTPNEQSHITSLDQWSGTASVT